MIAATPSPPYYAVIFTSIRTDGDDEAYAAMAVLMERLALQAPGCLGFESAREDLGVTVSYWRDLEAIAAWRSDVQHLAAQRLGRARWYSSYKLRVARVERDYDFQAADQP